MNYKDVFVVVGTDYLLIERFLVKLKNLFMHLLIFVLLCFVRYFYICRPTDIMHIHFFVFMVCSSDVGNYVEFGMLQVIEL